MVGRWIHALFGRKKRLSDIEYLSIKEFDGKLVENEKFLSATGDLATLTASSGKDMYLASAKVVFFANTQNASAATADEVVLKVNDVIKETVKFSWGANLGNATGGDLVFDYEFKNIGQKVAATQVIKLEVITLDADTDVEGYIQCFEETTGESPQI